MNPSTPFVAIVVGVLGALTLQWLLADHLTVRPALVASTAAAEAPVIRPYQPPAPAPAPQVHRPEPSAPLAAVAAPVETASRGAPGVVHPDTEPRDTEATEALPLQLNFSTHGRTQGRQGHVMNHGAVTLSVDIEVLDPKTRALGQSTVMIAPGTEARFGVDDGLVLHENSVVTLRSGSYAPVTETVGP